MFHQRLLSTSIAITLAAIAVLRPVAAPAAMLGALARSDLDPAATVQFSVYLPLSHPDALEKKLHDQTDPSSPDFQHWLTPAEFAAQFGPDPAAVAAATAALQAGGFSVVGRTTQALRVQGPASAVQTMFAAHLQRIATKGGHTRLVAAERQLSLPASLSQLGAVIPEFAALDEKRVHSVKLPQALNGVEANVRLSDALLYYPNDMREAYHFPSFLDSISPLDDHRDGRSAPLAGVGAHIAVLIDSTILASDLQSTFNSTFVFTSGDVLQQAYSANTSLPVPSVAIRQVDGGSGPFDPNSSSAAEASLDTQMSLGTAPGARETLYDIPDLSDASILDGYAAIIEDNRADVVSASFGGCELYYTPAYNGGVDFTAIPKTFHALFQQGNAQGISFVASTGDQGALDCLSADFVNNPTNGTVFVPGVESPASDPNVTGVGGTNLITASVPGPSDATYADENADYDPLVPASIALSSTETVTVGRNTWGSGGGISVIFARPSYQKWVPTASDSHRTVPDVALMMGGCPADADLTAQNCLNLPRSGALVWFNGQLNVFIGTSSSAPQFAGVVATAVQLNGGRLGNVNPYIYSLSAIQALAGGEQAPAPLHYFHRNIAGSNRHFKVKPGDTYSEVLGNGTLDVENFLLLFAQPAAGAPNTPSNP